jgi:hypothetical protein
MDKEDLRVMSERNLRHATDDKPADYLITELKERLNTSSAAGPVVEMKEKEEEEKKIYLGRDLREDVKESSNINGTKAEEPRPVAFRLQVQCPPLEPHHTTTSEEVYHVMKPWPASVFFGT